MVRGVGPRLCLSRGVQAGLGGDALIAAEAASRVADHGAGAVVLPGVGCRFRSHEVLRVAVVEAGAELAPSAPGLAEQFHDPNVGGGSEHIKRQTPPVRRVHADDAAQACVPGFKISPSPHSGWGVKGGGTVGQWLATQVEEAYASGGCCRCWTQDHFSTMKPREIT